MSKKKLPDLEIVEADKRGIELGFEKMRAMLARLPAVSSYSELREQVPNLIDAAVKRIMGAAAPFDAFDVIESLKMREMPMGLLGFSEREYDGIATVVEIGALALLSRGGRAATAPQNANPGNAVEPIDEAARELLLLGTFLGLDSLQASTADGAARAEIAEALRTHELAVRNRQYQSVRDEHDPRLFGDLHVSKDMKAALGFDYAEYTAVRRAIQEISGERLQTVADQFYGAFQDAQSAADWEVEFLPEDVRERAMNGLTGLFLRPGDRAAFTVGDIAAHSGVPGAIVQAVLTPFALHFNASDASAAIRAFLDGDNPFSAKSLLVDADRNYLSTGAQLGDDMLRTVVEKALSGKAKDRFVSARTRISEDLAAGYLEAMITPDQKFVNLKYWAPSGDQGPETVAKGSTDFKTAAKQTEMDALLIAEDVAICVEVKGASLRQESRGGNAVKLASDLAKTVGDAASQADRARALIEANHGLRTESGWLDLQKIREVHSVVVTLEDLGPAGIALDAMVRAGVVKTDRAPWVVSLHDLAVIARVIEHPAELLLYLRRRTSPTFAQVFHAVDELDLFMMFLSDGLFLEDDPDKVAAANPAAPPVTSAERKRYQRSLVPKTVATHTDPLDQWMYASEYPDEGTADQYPKPHFKSEAVVGQIVDEMTRERKPGWLRAGADLLAFSGDSQRRVASALQRTAEATRADGRWHNAFMSQMSEHGHFGLLVGSCPIGETVAEATARLEHYARVKVHQIHADRSLGLVVAPSGEIVGVGYGNHEWEEDAELESLATEMGLTTPDRMPHSMPPPSSRRATVRLRGPRKGKKRRR